jgi:hypothetical protein
LRRSRYGKARAHPASNSKLAANAAGLRPCITEDIIKASRPVMFTLPRGGRAWGFRAELLPVVCELYMKARQAKTLPPNQENIAKQAEILVRGLAQVGIIALVDEATGYQEVRQRDALIRILETFVDKELQAWVRTFPTTTTAKCFDCAGSAIPRRLPQYFAKLTNDIVYKRIAPRVLDELKRVQRKGSTGNRKTASFNDLPQMPGIRSCANTLAPLSP